MQDTIQKFIIDDTRCVILRLNQSLKTILSQREYPESIQSFMAECLAASILCSSTLKYKGQLTVQMQSDGPLRLIVAKCNHEHQIRGVARWLDGASDKELTQATQQGQLIVTIQADNHDISYQSIINLSGSLMQSFEHYFLQSEQINTVMDSVVSADQCVAVLVQELPNEGLSLLPNKLHANKLTEMSNQEYVTELFSHAEIQMFEPEPIEFACTCSREKSLSSVFLMDRQEITELLNSKPVIVVNCEYCNTEYTYSKDEIEFALEPGSSDSSH